MLFCPASWVSADAPTQSTRDYILWYRNYDSPAINALVNLALSKTPEYGAYRLVRSQELSQGRVLRELSRNRSRLVDIANVATSEERETFLTAVPIPIDGGLLGFRVCVVRPEHLPLFENIHTLEDLENSNIRIGQGTHWPDTEVLRANNIQVVTHTRYEILFSMLRNNRFECFARGASEVLYDLKIEADPNLVIEPNILLAYAMPSYLFVAPEDQQTAHRLQLGMERAILDGSFGEFLRTYYGRAVQALNLPGRRVLVLENPYLSEESGYVGRRTLESLRHRLELLSR
ncbi:transporter substrate-binding domain-containing protein [Marinobacter sp. CAU 1620]|nr:transporter substrate-binding domain-containing protein [Marinobacter arenosus]MBW0146252.1 transporter substrate-binding domain-containing protein [Marinobacter arenosus]